MRRLLLLLSPLLLAACVDTTGIAPESSKPVHPQTSSNAAVTIYEYADLQCPACRNASAIVDPVIQQYGTQVRFEFRHFPLQSIHRYAIDAAQASECAADQGKFWDYVKLAYEKQPELSRDSLYAWAEQLGLDADLFDRCFRSGIKRDAVIADYESGIELGVDSTPTFVLNGQIVRGTTVDFLQKAVGEALAGAASNL